MADLPAAVFDGPNHLRCIMNPTYAAAEYFIEILRKDPTYCINYHSLNLDIEQAPENVALYLKEQGQNDPLFLFKKFPDVFILDGSNIMLTDAFLTLYAFPQSTKFCSNKTSRNAPETAAIEYFKLILIRCGRVHFLNLFSNLLNQRGLWWTEFFVHYKKEDMLEFFLMHSDSFIVLGNLVYLKIHPVPVKNIELSAENIAKALKQLSFATNFLLSCFKSLHYLQLKQCISFEFVHVRNYLNSFSLIQQRCLFENLPETVMDNKGFLFLNNAEYTPGLKLKKRRLMMLIVCILAFERPMHYRRIAQEVYQRVSIPLSSILCNLSESKQFRFFVNRSKYFVIEDNGYVSLQPSFVFPRCSFDDSGSYSLASSSQVEINTSTSPVEGNPSILNLNHENPQAYSQSNNESIQTPSMRICDAITLKVCDFSLKSNPSNYDGTFGEVELAIHSFSVRLKIAVIYLNACFVSPFAENVLDCCLYVMNDVQKSFTSLSHAGKLGFVQDYCNFFEKVSQATLTTLPSLSPISNREKILLFIVYALSHEQKIHFETLSSWIDYSKVDSGFSQWSNRLIYFKQLLNHVTVSTDGFVTLNKSFRIVHFMILPFFNGSLDSSVSKCAACKTDPSLNVESCTECIANETDGAVVFNMTDGCIVDESIIPALILKKIQLSLLHLNTLFDNLVAVNFLETCLHSLREVQLHFFNLSLPQRHRFVESLFRKVTQDSVLLITCLSSEIPNCQLTNQEKAVMSITYLLTEVTSAHYLSLAKKLKPMDIKDKLSKTERKQFFRHVKSLKEYFNTDGTGFFSLSPSFSFIETALNSLSAFCNKMHERLQTTIQIILNDASSQNAKEDEAVSPECNLPDVKVSYPPDAAINLRDLIIDLSISKLSLCKKIKIDVLCKILNCSEVKPVQNYFSYQTVAVVKKFFVDIPEYFEVTRDDFIILKKDVVSSYAPKTSLIRRDSKGILVLNKSSDLINYSGPDFVVSGYSSDASATSKSSDSKMTRISKRKKKSSSKYKYTSNNRCSTFLSNKLENSFEEGTSEGQEIVSKNQQANSVGEKNGSELCPSRDIVQKQNFAQSSTVEQLSQTCSISPSYTLKFYSQSSSLSIPKRNTIELQPNQQPHLSSPPSNILQSENTKKLPPENFLRDSIHSKNVDSKLPKPVCSGAKMPGSHQPLEISKESPQICDSSVFKDGETVSSAIANDILNASYFPELKKSDSLEDLDPFVSYGVELVNAYLEDTSLGSISGESKARDQLPSCATSPDTRDEGYSFHSSSPDLCDDSYSVQSFSPDNSDGANRVRSHPEQEYSRRKNSEMVTNAGCSPAQSVSPAEAVSPVKKTSIPLPRGSCRGPDIIVEYRAINFFSFLLGNYDSGASASFLVKHLNLASTEVRTFMIENYWENLVSFFLKHKKIFHVLPGTDHVYLLRAK